MMAKLQEVFHASKFSTDKLTGHLEAGDLLSFENLLWSELLNCYHCIASVFLTSVAANLEPVQRVKAQELGLKKLTKRSCSVQLRTGHRIEIEGLYAKIVPDSFHSSRHLLHQFWHIEKGASPAYYSTISLFSVLCPSFEVAGQILDNQMIKHDVERNRQLTSHIAKRAFNHQADLTHHASETFAKKRIVIQIDGGRTRIRKAMKVLLNGRKKYETAWREPKLFVIEVIDENGRVDYKQLSTYGVRFGKDDLITLLASHLKKLHVEQATQVQIVADGAPWIWNETKQMLLTLGVQEARIVETLDYYHAANHLMPIVKSMVKKGASKNKGKKDDLFKAYKDLIWNGKASEMISTVKEKMAQLSQKAKAAVAYFEKHLNRMQYADNQANKLLCGSGIVESGIRRVINLRFKNTATFWHEDNVEPMYFLRGIMLSYRWDIMMQNFIKL